MEQLPPVFFAFGGDFFRFFLFDFSYGKVRKKERRKIIKKKRLLCVGGGSKQPL